MGRIKTAKVKRTANMLNNKYPEKFNANFDENKRVLYNLNIFNSIKFRNTVAGLISKIRKKKK